ncbi:hypothetical protein KP509_39G055100 [Ceratopteris richardii]|uniref:Nitrate regulatory gene2 protein-like n=1 Tax=Ceratopteris richardii TaxID=49495 RepID=A0A8T2Q0P4_CERRI|nr:hypothetical protein KP509_39G055100 [Ceratopteris richardii]
MGCVSSNVETGEAVRRCKSSKHSIKQAVIHRHAFATAHASYVKSLKSIGAAICQFVDVELPKEDAAIGSSVSHQNEIFHGVSNLPPPPQPPQDPLSGLQRNPLPRAASMPPMPIKSLVGEPSKNSRVTHSAIGKDGEEQPSEDLEYVQHRSTHSETIPGLFDSITDSGTHIFEDFGQKDSAIESTSELDDIDDDYEEESNDDRSVIELQASKHYKSETSPLQAEIIDDKQRHHKNGLKQSDMTSTKQKLERLRKDFRTLIHQIDDLFLESHKAGRRICGLLEAHMDYYHIPFVDEISGIKEHNKKVSHVLSWKKTSEQLEAEEKDDGSEENINLATTIDRLHAWEKKRYDEVKVVESTRVELEKRTAQLKLRKERGASATGIQRTRALVKSLQSRYFVEVEAVDAAVSELKRLRDKYLYSQLMELLKVLKDMWSVMQNCHELQIPLVEELKAIRNLPTIKKTSDFRKKLTDELEREIVSWHNNIVNLLSSQNDWMEALVDWLHLNAEQIETDGENNLSTLQNVDHPLLDLCHKWADSLKRLSAEELLQSLNRFSSSLHEITVKVEDEIKQKISKEILSKELEKKRRSLASFENKYKYKISGSETSQYQGQSLQQSMEESKARLELLAKTAAEEEEKYLKLCDENNILIFESLKNGLPEVIRSITAFSQACANEYGNLYKYVVSG